ncbi:MAG: carboxypeptidase-like regulatory domain-containing protein [Flavobacteriia bacterium]|nr:carboxypeptidase-like regulatory domain-containing protein [Flavobacteriia bacterium]
MTHKVLLTLFISIFCLFFVNSQNLVSGIITDETNSPIPFAQIYSKNNAELRTVADINGYYEMRLFIGEYFLVFTANGYDDREAYIAISNFDLKKDMQLFPTKIQDLGEVAITAKKSNPGREIMLKVVAKRDTINPWNYPHSCEVYIKASEKLDFIVKEKKKNKEEKKTENTTDSNTEIPKDPFEEKKKAENLFINGMNLIEVQLTRHFAPPTKIKEIRNAYEARGNTQDLYYTTTVKSDFNFFQNLLHLNDLHQSPVSSPISGPGILSYKYRLVEQYEENGRKIHKIKIIPRNTATTTLEGFIWVIDSVWLVQKLELSMAKGNLLLYDYFTIKQEFDTPGDSICILKSQVLTYGIKNKNKISSGSTTVDYSKYNFKPKFSPKFFSNELSVTEEEAYEKDSTFWNQSRATALTEDEKRFIIVKDSIHDVENRKEYLDSIDHIFNKITPLKVLWFGVDHRNRDKKVQWTINSLAGLIRPVYIAGPRLDPGFYYFKKWKNQRSLDIATDVSYGFLNKDLKGNLQSAYLHDPFHFGTIGMQISNDFGAIVGYDAVTQVYKRANFIEKTEFTAYYSRELWNGFYAMASGFYSERRNIDNYKFINAFDKVIPNNEPSHFKTYQAFIGELQINYTPGQKYMKEKNRKVVLGSKWPTFYAKYERGIPGLIGSDVDHEYGLVGIRQTFKLGTLGTTSYHFKTAKFLSSRALYDADYKYNRRSDPFIFSNPLYSFQGLTKSLPSKKIIFEFHFIHHDNSAIINKIPFMKKTRLGLVFGGGALYVRELNWQHYEVLGGLERNFRLSRQILRLGIYGVLSDGNHINPTTTWKVSFSFINTRTMKWNF